MFLYGAKRYVRIEVHNVFGRSDLEVDAGSSRRGFELKFLSKEESAQAGKAEALFHEACEQIVRGVELLRAGMVFSEAKRHLSYGGWGVTKESQMIQDRSANREQGFSLLEIVTVLVLLGVIASVLAPRYFDMQQQAEMRAAEAALAEVQVRINTKFSKKIQNGAECAEAQKEVNQLASLDPNEKVGDGYRFNHHIISGGEIPTSAEQNAVWNSTIKREDGGYSFENLAQLRVPVCLDWTEMEEKKGCRIFDTDYNCFDSSTPCQHLNADNQMIDGGDWKMGSLVDTSDGIYVVDQNPSCFDGKENIGYKYVENPKDYPNLLIKLNINRQRFWSETEKRWEACEKGDILQRGDWYSDGTDVFVYSLATNEKEYGWTATSAPPKREIDDVKSNNWIRVHSWIVISP